MPLSAASNWLHEFDTVLPVFGHRNWIVVADAAYPDQMAPGIRTIVADGDPIDVIATVLHRIDSARHVRPHVTVDAEMQFVDDQDAPGAAKFRERLRETLGSHPVAELPHEQIIAKLDAAGQTFHILIIKTSLTIPYTSVFLELDCGYWSAASEAKMRAVIAAQG
jgi:hypothetical protein